jgi:hypothetical protein
VTSTGHTGGLQQILGQRRFPDIVEVWFSDLYIGGQGCPQFW